LCGFIESSGNGWIYKDQGGVVTENVKLHKSNVFTAPASPALVLETLDWLVGQGSIGKDENKPKGYRNVLAILKRFELIYVKNDKYFVAKDKLRKFSENREALWISANSEEILLQVVKLLESDDQLSGKDIGEFVAEKHELTWTDASKARNGGAIRQWAMWLYQGKKHSEIPLCPGRI
jgi:hypothetical protein